MFSDLNFYNLTEEEFNRNINYYSEKEIYLYHFIIYKYKDKYIKVDNMSDLKKIDYNNLICKFYIEKIHFFNESGNDYFEYGNAYHIYNLGYYYIGGFVTSKLLKKDKVKKVFKEYMSNYKNMDFPFTDAEFIEKNKNKMLF